MRADGELAADIRVGDNESTVTLLKLTWALLLSVIVSPLSVAFANVGLFGVPSAMLTVSPLVSTALPDQLAAVFQSLLTAPVQFSVLPADAAIVTGIARAARSLPDPRGRS